ncbi:MAG: acyl-CoA dehydrogenase family protein, partial [Alphaproteobacteria bacterium]
MDFQLTTEQQLIYDYGGAVAKDLDYKYWTDKARKNEFTQELWDRVAADGFLGIMVPEEYGGAGLGMMEMALLMEGLSNHGIPLLMLVVGPTMSMGLIAKHASEEMKRAYLPDLCAGKTQFCFAITEPDAGSNSVKTQTFAKARGNRFALKGTKTFITGADVADYALVVSRTTPLDQAKRKTDGFTLFAVDLKDKNIEKHRVEVSIPTPDTQWTL